jgi:pilus assembly protein Flp/PilA
MSMFRKLIKDENGATAIEYGLIAALISVAAIVAFTAVGSNIGSVMNTVSDKMAGG